MKKGKSGEKYFVHESAWVDRGAIIGEGTSIWHFSHVCGGARIGRNCRIGQNVFISGTAVIGDNVKIQNNVSVYDGVILEDYAFCGPSMVFTNILNPRSAYPRNTVKAYVKTVVKKGASIGANSTVVCGHTIGENAFIGAGSVVTKDVKAYALLYGNPARVKGWMCACGNKLEFENGSAACGACKKKYINKNDNVKEIK